ncbi:MAG: hypothetical protein F9K22_06945 [Bacteroidetes bacterium]|nr:MAG: hypothetical protein F9K22_06945 [Bacteroidota bacterium]
MNIRDDDQRLLRHLHGKGVLDRERHERCERTLALSPERSIVDVLIDTAGIDELTVGQAVSELYTVPFVLLTPSMVACHDAGRRQDFLQRYHAVPVTNTGVEVTVGFYTPPYRTVIEALKRQEKAFIVPVITTRSAFRTVAGERTGDGQRTVPSKYALEQLDLATRDGEKVAALVKNGPLPTADILTDEIFIRAINAGASDIYLEPSASHLRVLFNMTGVLSTMFVLPREVKEQIINVIRVRGNLNIFEKNRSQEGSYAATYGGAGFQFRMSTLSTGSGERLIIRVIRAASDVPSLETTGISPENLTAAHRLAQRSHGLTVIAGPPGAGKTTTAYALLTSLRDSGRNIVTVERPIEAPLTFANQVQCDSGQQTDNATMIRSVMRYRPDVLFIGALTDADTGLAAAEAALSGALVVTTVTAGDVESALLRLMNLGIPEAWLPSLLNGIIFQRLTRRICPDCSEAYTPVRQDLAAAGMAPLENLISFYRGTGCAACLQTGHSGQLAVHEVLEVDGPVREALARRASGADVLAAAYAQGGEPFRFDAAKKLVSGIVSIDDYLRLIH